MGKNLPSMNPLLKIWIPSFSSHILMPHEKEDSMKTPMDSPDNTSRKNSIQPYLGSASPVGDGKTQ